MEKEIKTLIVAKKDASNEIHSLKFFGWKLQSSNKSENALKNKKFAECVELQFEREKTAFSNTELIELEKQFNEVKIPIKVELDAHFLIVCFILLIIPGVIYLLTFLIKKVKYREKWLKAIIKRNGILIKAENLIKRENLIKN